ncbi:MAG: hypothetical protein OSJ76_08740 [Alphaproteobacteria bacterium]|nr:hypothetical protein [Alphaproteobacteria bacterium]
MKKSNAVTKNNPCSKEQGFLFYINHPADKTGRFSDDGKLCLILKVQLSALP